MKTNRYASDRGFTLVELLVVVLIVVLVSAATLPVVIPALNHRQVSESARILQAAIAGARDAAIRTNAPRGIRFLPDPAFPGPTKLAANRMISIEAAPDYTSGFVDVPPPDVTSLKDPVSGNSFTITQLIIKETVLDGNGLPTEPTSWYWNIRQGDKIRFDDSGRYYRIAGPIVNANPERYINNGPPTAPPANFAARVPEFLIVTNGQDDDGDGFIDESFDGIDNDLDGIVDPGYNGTINNPAYNSALETEPEKFIGSQFSAPLFNQKYTIFRRPVVSESAREVALPQGMVVDMTSWNAPSGSERSRLPIDPVSFYVDVMFLPNGQVMPGGPASAALSLPFYHFWLSERDDVFDPIWGLNAATFAPNPNPGLPTFHYVLPMPQGTPNYDPVSISSVAGTTAPYLKGERRLVTLFVRTGLVVTNEVEIFDGLDTGTPYYLPQLGTRQSQ